MRTRIFFKLVLGLAVMITLALGGMNLLNQRSLDRTFLDDARRDLAQKARILALAEPASFAEAAKAARVQAVLIGPDGSVLEQSAPGAADQTFPDLSVSTSTPRGILRVSTSARAVEAEAAAARQRLLFNAALAFVPVVLIALYLAHNTSWRLGMLTHYAGELANGNFHARVPEFKTGELAHLGRKLNETSANLERTVQQLQTEHAELEKLERIRKDFVINVSHELRTPLASIQGYTETLMDGALNDEANNMRFLRIIRHNAERLARLTADLLALSRIEMKTQEFRFASYRINELLTDVLDTIRPLADKKQIALKQEFAPLGTEVFCDSEALYQMLSNLVDNAVKYTPEQGIITIGVKLLTVTTGPRMLEVFVRDTGVGIPVEDQSRLFERFYRVDKARSRELGGTGLGLAIVKHLVRTHGGDVRVESEIGKGSTFFFSLPVEEIAHLDPPPQLHPEFTAS